MRRRDHDRIIKQYQAEIDRLRRELVLANSLLVHAEEIRRQIDPDGFCGCNVCKAIRMRDIESFIPQVRE